MGTNDAMNGDKVCLVLLIVQNDLVARRQTSRFSDAGFDVRRLSTWAGESLDFDPEVVIVEIPRRARSADVATRLRAKARFGPLILVGLSPSPSAEFESERRVGRHSGFDDVFPADVDAGSLVSRIQQLLRMRPPLTPCQTRTPPAA